MPDSPHPIRHAHGDDDGARERAIGPELVMRFQGLLRAARLYSSSNQAYQRQLQDFMAIVVAAMQEEEATLVAMADYFYLNGVRLKAQASKLSSFHLLFAEFECRALGAVRFLRGVNAEELEAFLKLFLAARNELGKFNDRAQKITRIANGGPQ